MWTTRGQPREVDPGGEDWEDAGVPVRPARRAGGSAGWMEGRLGSVI